MKLPTALIVAGVIVGAMAVTNPSKDRYAYYASEEFTERGKDFICSLNIPSDGYKQFCGLGIPVGKTILRPLVEAIVNQFTTQQNFVIFSIYVTDLPSKKLTTIAAFGNFYMFR